MNKKLLALGAAVLVIGGGIFVYTKNSSSSNEVVLPYGKGTSIEGDIPSFNPVQTDNTPTHVGLHQTIAELMAFKKDGSLEPYAAKKVDVSKDAKSVHVELKDGLKCEDGSKVLAQDYENGIKLLVDPKAKSSYGNWGTDWVKGAKEYADGKAKSISGFKKISDTEFDIELSKPVGFFDTLLSSEMFTPIPDKFISKIGGLENYGKDYKKVISSGPMKFANYEAGKHLDLIKNTKSVLSKGTKVEKLKIVPVSSFSTGTMMYKNKKLYAIEKTEYSDKVLGKKKSDKPNQVFNNAWMEYLAFNTKKVDAKTQQGLYKALDKKYVINNFFYGTYKTRNVITPDVYTELGSELKSKNGDVNKNDFDFNKAKEMTKDAKSKDLKVIISSDKNQNPSFVSYYKYLKAQWEKLGFNVELKEVPGKNFSSEVNKKVGAERNYDVALKAWSNDYPEASTFLNSLLGSNTENNFTGWTSSTYDKEISSAISSSSKKDAATHYAKAMSEAQNKSGLYPMWQYTSNVYTQDGKFSPYCIGGVLYVNYW